MEREPMDGESMDHEPAARENENLPNPNPEGHEGSPQVRVPVAAASLASGYELADVRLRPIVVFAVSLLIAAAVGHLVLFLLLRAWTGRPLPFTAKIPPVTVSLPAVPGPGLDAAPESQLEQLYKIETDRLSAYGWIDQDAGQVRIPITRAMQLVVESGLPAQDGPAPDFRLAPAFRMDSSGGLQPVGEEPGAGGEGTSGGSATEDIVIEEGAPPGDGSGEQSSETRNNGESMTGGASTEEGVVEEGDRDD